MNYSETPRSASVSRDDIHPWRVVGLGSGWAVVDTGERVWWQGDDVYEAHAQARVARLLHPAGKANRIDGDPCNISGPLDSIPERLAGLAFAVAYRNDAGWPYRAAVRQEPGASLKVYSYNEHHMTELSVEILAHDARYAIELDVEPFRKAEKVDYA